MNNTKRTSCNCNHAHARESHVKGNSTAKDSDRPKHSHQHESEKRNLPYWDHLFCFTCEKFLRSQYDVTSHQCEPTRLLSRKWHKEATWTRNKYKCKICSDQLFQCKVCLEKHMCEHMQYSEERLSELFRFVPSSSNQTHHVDARAKTGHDLRSDTCHDDTQEPQQPMLYICDICNLTFTTVRHLKGHKTRMHSGNSTNSQETRQKCPFPQHLYCFYCNKFLKSQAEISCHKCKTTRLLSRYWYKKAEWAKNEYECTFCPDKFFSAKNSLEKHMLAHEDKRSQLFQFVPSSSNQTTRVASLENTYLEKNVSVKRNTYRSHASNGHSAVMSLQEQRKQTELPPVEDEDLTDDINSDMSYHDDNYEVALDTANENVSIEVGVIEETRPSNISVELNHNTPGPADINEPSIHFNCENCGRVFYLSNLFIAHVMMFPNCLMFYETLDSEPPALVPFCFKCKRTIRTDTRHQCIGVVAIMYKCALCYSMFPNIYNLSEHENEKHPVTIKHEHVETIQTVNDNNIFINLPTVQR